MLPHVGVHGRRHDDGLGERQVHRAEQVVGDAVGHLGQRVGGSRGHHHDVGFLAVVDVGDARVRRELTDLILADGMCGKSLEGHGADELRGGTRHDHANLHARFLEAAQQFGSLIGGYPSGDADEQLASLHGLRRRRET